MKPGDFVRYGAGLAFNTAYNYLKPNSQEPIGSQIQLYRNMKFYMKRKHASRTRTVVKKRRKTRGGGGSSGIVGPMLPRPVAPRKMSKYDLYGSRGEDEVYRSTSRNSMNMLGFTSFKVVPVSDGVNNSVSGSLVYHVAAALLRNLLKSHFKIDVSRHNQVISVGHSGSGTTSTLMRPVINFIYREHVAAGVDEVFGIGYTLSLGSLATNPKSGPVAFSVLVNRIVTNVICSDAFGARCNSVNNGVRSLYGYVLQEPDIYAIQGVNLGYSYQNLTSGCVRLDEMYIKAYSKAEIALQNTTVADGAAADGQYLDNRIDANPLQGRILKFSTPVPDLREPIPSIDIVASANMDTTSGVYVPPSVTLLANSDVNRWCYDINNDGIICPSDSYLLTGDYDQLPGPERFRHLSGLSNFVLQPGEIRKAVLNFKFDGSIPNFIKGMNLSAGGLRMNDGHGLGTCCLFAVEKVMSTGESAAVSLNYQLSYWAGCYIKRSRRVCLLPFNKDGAYTGAAD